MFSANDRVFDVTDASHEYEVSEFLGRGAQGFVYRVQKTSTNIV